MKLFFNQQIACSTILISLLALSQTTSLTAWWHPKLPTLKTEVDVDNAAKVIKAVADEEIDNFGQTCTQLANTTIEKATDTFDKRYPEVKEDMVYAIDYGVNEMRLVPVYLTGTAFLLASVNMYWQSLNDYLNTTKTTDAALTAMNIKMYGKLKTGLILSCLAAGVLYKRQALSKLLLGYTPKIEKTTPDNQPEGTPAQEKA